MVALPVLCRQVPPLIFLANAAIYDTGKRGTLPILGKDWGRNELIGLYVTLETGRFATRKRISSKLQSG